MNEKGYLYHQDTQNLFGIFAIMACILPVYYGFKKSAQQGVINSALVLGVLFVYFSVPGSQIYIMMCFSLFIVIGLITHTKDVLFP